MLVEKPTETSQKDADNIWLPKANFFTKNLVVQLIVFRCI